MVKNYGRTFEYVMSKEMAKDLLERRKGEVERKKRPQDYLIEYVNTERGIMGTCTRVILE